MLEGKRIPSISFVHWWNSFKRYIKSGLLSVAMSILVCPCTAANYQTYAHVLVHFVTQGKTLYGQEFMVYNVHCLLHIQSDMLEYGSLDRCSAFPFENYLHRTKKLVHSGKNSLVQIITDGANSGNSESVFQETK